MYIYIFVEAIIQQLNDDIEVLKKELYKYQHSSDKSDVAVQCSVVSGIWYTRSILSTNVTVHMYQ